jgi:regulator of nonsense transcripts 3
MLDTLSAVVKQCNFQDAKNTSKDPCLLGPPSLEFAPYGRVPGSRVRKDGRQGTIDQDPEFIDFLQGLTEPVAKSNINGDGIEGTDTKPVKLTTTPLVEYLKEKKANKGKDGAASKTVKSQGKPEAKEAKAEKTDVKKVPVAKKEAQRSPEKVKIEKSPQDAVKAVSKSVVIPKSRSDTSESATPSSKAPITTPTPVKRERERGSASVAARILQRDLGLVPARGDRKVPRSANTAPKTGGTPESEPRTVPAALTTRASDKAPGPTTTTPSAQPSTSSPRAPTAPPTGPRISKPPVSITQPIHKPVSAPSARPSRPPPNPSPGARSAFLKHANFSQGVTEEPLYTAFTIFGAVTRCEIDRKKGFGYVDFEDPESLKKALFASPVKVGDKGGQVVVLENKNSRSKSQTPTPQSAPTEGKMPVQPQNPGTISPKPEAVEVVPKASAVTATPTTLRGAHAPFRGGASHHGPRGGYTGPPRGGFNRAGRGSRGNFRGRGTFESNRGSGHANGKNTSSVAAATAVTGPSSVPTPATHANTDGAAG